MTLRLFRALTMLELMVGFMIVAMLSAIVIPSVASAHGSATFPMAIIFAVGVAGLLTLTTVFLWLRWHHRRHRAHVAPSSPRVTS